MSDLDEMHREFEAVLRKASVAQVGGFRPPGTHLTSWFGGQGVGLPGETLPTYKGKDMFPLLQARIDELPFVPEVLTHTAMLIVFMNRETLPFDQEHGDGWEIREYSSLDGLVPLPPSNEEHIVKSFPIRWNLVENDVPGWEDLNEIAQWASDEDSRKAFYELYESIYGTKFGGYPQEIQFGVGVKDFVFQIDCEPKAQWFWGDQGIGYFHKVDGVWQLSWQCL